MSANPYDPVTTTDSTNLADDDWGLNLPNIRYKNYGSSRCKGFFNFLKTRVRLLVILGCILIIGIALISIIVIASSGSSQSHVDGHNNETRWESPSEGLVFYPMPVDGSVVIDYVLDKAKDNPLIESLNNVTEEYQMQLQLKNPYTDCSKDNNPPDKICRLGNTHFGNVCTKTRGWGYIHATPCIFLQLNLPENTTIKPIHPEALLWPVAKLVMGNHNDSTFVPVTCQGTTHADREILGLQGFDKSDPHPIQYFPPDGLPSYFYRERNMSLPFLKPAMMIYLTSLKDNTLVHINCTAWGQMYDYNGNMLDHKLLQTMFAVHLRV